MPSKKKYFLACIASEFQYARLCPDLITINESNKAKGYRGIRSLSLKISKVTSKTVAINEKI